MRRDDAAAEQPYVLPHHVSMLTQSDIARDLAHRLRDGAADRDTLEAAALTLESLAELYEKSRRMLERLNPSTRTSISAAR